MAVNALLGSFGCGRENWMFWIASFSVSLVALTVNPAVLPPLHFGGGSNDGIDDVYLKLERS
jgi:hypothetical protein